LFEEFAVVRDPKMEEFVDDGFGTETGWLAKKFRVECKTTFAGATCPLILQKAQADLPGFNANALRPGHHL